MKTTKLTHREHREPADLIEPAAQQPREPSGNRAELNRLEQTIRMYQYTGLRYGSRKDQTYFESCMRAYNLIFKQTKDTAGLVLRPGNMRYYSEGWQSTVETECLIDESTKPLIDSQGKMWSRLKQAPSPGAMHGPDHTMEVVNP